MAVGTSHVIMQALSDVFKTPYESLPPALSVRQPCCHRRGNAANEEAYLYCIADSTGSACTASLVKSKTGTALKGATCVCSAFMCNLLCGHVTAVVRAWLAQPSLFTMIPHPTDAVHASGETASTPGTTWLESGRVADCYSSALDRHKSELHKAVAAACAHHDGLLPSALLHPHTTAAASASSMPTAKTSSRSAATAKQSSLGSPHR